MNNQIPGRNSGLCGESSGYSKSAKGPEFCQFPFSGREAGDELLRLRAKYARAYAASQNHEHNCSLCQLASRIEERQSESSSDAASDNELYT